MESPLAELLDSLLVDVVVLGRSARAEEGATLVRVGAILYGE